MSKFPEGFLWGSSTNAPQFEGGNNEGGKGLSIANFKSLENDGKKMSREFIEEFEDASDHYHRFKEDIALYAEMGFTTYRFTMAWSRIYPNETDIIPSEKGLQFYDNMVNELLKYNIKPICTLYAYDMPIWVMKKYSGFLERGIIDEYKKYVKTVAEHFKGRIKLYVPFNEQNSYSHYNDGVTVCTYPIKNEREYLMCEHHNMMCYATAVNLVHTIDPDAKVGGNIMGGTMYPKTLNPKDIEYVDKAEELHLYNYCDAFVFGEYSSTFMKKFSGNEDIILENDLKFIKQNRSDFLSTTYYFSSVLNHHQTLNIPWQFFEDLNPYLNATEWKWSIDPYGFKKHLKDLYFRYRIPILVLENGLAHADVIAEDGKIHDDYRIDYLREHIKRMKEAIDEGVNVLGYCTWSATDLCSTHEGFRKRYGLVYVDRDNDYKRIRKDSFYWYKKIIYSNGEDLD